MPTEWENMTEDQKEAVRKNGRKWWANRTEEQKQRRIEKDHERNTNLTEEQKQRRRKSQRKWNEGLSEEKKKLRYDKVKNRRAKWTEEQKIEHADKHREWHANRSEEEKEQMKKRATINARVVRASWTEEDRQRKRDRARELYANLPEERKEQIHRRAVVSTIKQRADKNRVPFNLTLDYINEIWPDDNKCPALGILLERGKGNMTDHSPCIDKIVPSLGYVVGNIQIVCNLANRIKTNATPAQVMIVAQYLIKEERAST